MAVIKRGSACPSWPMACLMALGFVDSFTLGSRIPASNSWKERSRTGRTFLLLCGIAASRLILRFSGMSSLSLSHRASHASLASTFSMVLACKHAIASAVQADGWFPQMMATVMCLCDHGGPQSTGHPFCAYCRRRL